MSSDDRAVLDAVLRKDLASFIQRTFQTVVPGQRFLPNWHVEAIAHQLERCRRGESRRLIITMPPRYLKSICGSVAFPAFVLGHDPTRRIVCVSYSQETRGQAFPRLPGRDRKRLVPRAVSAHAHRPPQEHRGRVRDDGAR